MKKKARRETVLLPNDMFNISIKIQESRLTDTEKERRIFLIKAITGEKYIVRVNCKITKIWG